MHRTTSNEPLRIVQQTKDQKGFEAWHALVRRYDQRNMSDKSSAYAALISNISEKDGAKDVEQFDDILRTFTNEMSKSENRFGKIRDEEKMLAVKKLMPESLLNYRFRGTTMSYSELFLALENIIIDKVSTVPPQFESRKTTQVLRWKSEWQRGKTVKVRAKKETKGSQTSLCKLSTKELEKESGALTRVRSGVRRVAKVARTEAKDPGRKAVVRNEAKDKRKAKRRKGREKRKGF